MYRLLIVDDEDIEREGMAQFIPWEDYGVQMMATARNGAEGLDKMEKIDPDIVITDIKMPVMDGLQLIRLAQERFQDVEFIVLSGYGEYEFTSRAMELGIHHYLLKPCDEEQIQTVLEKVKAEITEKREKRNKERAYQGRVKRMLPHAKEQLFREMLWGKERPTGKLQELFVEGASGGGVLLLALRIKSGFEGLERFLLENVLSELLGEEKIYASASEKEELLFLLDGNTRSCMEGVVKTLKKEFSRINSKTLRAAVSSVGDLEEVFMLYGQMQQLFRIGSLEKTADLFNCGTAPEKRGKVYGLKDFQQMERGTDFEELVFETYLWFMKMQLEKYSLEQKIKVVNDTLEVFWKKKLSGDVAWNEQEEWRLSEETIKIIAQCKRLNLPENSSIENRHAEKILLLVFRYIANPKLSVRFLAKEVLFMNEDYISRIFMKSRGERFSAYLLRQRIRLAQRLLEYQPDIKIGYLAEMVGYAPDGQYFSKAFRKILHMSPKAYREKVLLEQEQEEE